MIAFPCSRCGQKLQVADQLAGRKAKCPHCSTTVEIPPAELAPTLTVGGEGDKSGKRLPAPAGDLTATATRTPRPTPPSARVPPELSGLLAPPQAAGEIGRLGPYRVLKILGRGGMGVVYQAEDPQLQRSVALKAVLPALLSVNPQAHERFLREARAAAAIKHDHIVTIYQVGEDRGVPFLAMEFLEGEPLDARLKRAGRLTPGEVLRLGREVAEGLAAAHQHDLIHRDIKPANLWLEGERGRVKILDFGLARPAHADSHLTQEGAVMGTPAFMAPEQAAGRPLDGRCDLFSLGCVLYAACTGELPFRGSDPISTLMAVVGTDPAPPRTINPEVPASLSDLVMRLLAKDPADRPPSARAVVEMIQVLDQTPTLGLERGRGHGPTAGQRRRRLVFTGLAVVLLAAAGTAAAFHLLSEEQDEESGPAANPKAAAKPTPESEVRPPPPGTPLSPLALVSQPASVPRVHSWSLETHDSRGGVEAVAFNPKSGRLAYGGSDGTLRVLDRTGQLVQALVGHSGPVTCLAWSPDGRVLASGGNDRTVRLWAARSGQLLHVLAGHTKAVRSLAWSPDGRQLASGANDKTVRFWRVASGKELLLLQGPGGPVTALAWSSRGDRLAACGQEPTTQLWLWDPASGKPQGNPQPARGGLSWSPDGRTLAYVVDGKVRLLKAGTQGPGRALDLGPEEIKNVAWSPDGLKLATSSQDGNIKVWDARTRAQLGGWGAEPSVSLAWSPDSKTVAQGTRQGLQIHDVLLSKRRYDLPRHPLGGALALAPDGKTLACGNDDGTVRVWKVESGRLLRTLVGRGGAGLKTTIGALAWTADGRVLAAGCDDGGVRVWYLEGQGRYFHSFAGSVHALAWSPDGETLACLIQRSPRNSTMQLWEVGTGRPLRTLAGEGPIHFLAWSPDGKLLASGSAGRFQAVRLWDVENGRLRTLAGHAGRVTTVAFAPGGLLASGSRDGVVRVWEIPSGQLRYALPGHSRPIFHLAWSPDGQVLASGTEDHILKLWQAESGKPLRVLRGPRGRISALAWSPDSKRIAIQSATHVFIWEAATGKRIHLLPRSWGNAAALVWSRDGRTLVSSYRQGKVELWEPGPGRLRCTLLTLRDAQGLALSPAGHHRASSPQGEGELVYVVQTAKGQETLSPTAFATRYHWKNDPERVRLGSK